MPSSLMQASSTTCYVTWRFWQERQPLRDDKLLHCHHQMGLNGDEIDATWYPTVALVSHTNAVACVVLVIVGVLSTSFSSKAALMIAFISIWCTWKLPVAVVALVARPTNRTLVCSRPRQSSRRAVASLGCTYAHAPMFLGSSYTPQVGFQALEIPSTRVLESII